MWGRVLGNHQGGTTHFTTWWVFGGVDLKRGQWHSLSSRYLPGKKLLPGTHPIASHFTSSPYAICTLPPVALVLKHRGGGSWNICGPFNKSFLRILQFLPLVGILQFLKNYLSLPQPPLAFIARIYEDLTSWHWYPGLPGLVWDWDCSLLRYPYWFLSITNEWGTTHSAHISVPFHASLHLH